MNLKSPFCRMDYCKNKGGTNFYLNLVGFLGEMSRQSSQLDICALMKLPFSPFHSTCEAHFYQNLILYLHYSLYTINGSLFDCRLLGINYFYYYIYWYKIDFPALLICKMHYKKVQNNRRNNTGRLRRRIADGLFIGNVSMASRRIADRKILEIITEKISDWLLTKLSVGNFLSIFWVIKNPPVSVCRWSEMPMNFSFCWRYIPSKSRIFCSDDFDLLSLSH